MDYQTKQYLVRRIISGKFMGSINWNDERIFVSFLDPTLDISFESDWVYKNKYETLKSLGNIITAEESYQLLRQSGQWTDENDKQVVELKADIKYLYQQLSANRFNKTAQVAIKATIDKGKEKIKVLENKKNQLLPNTIEFMATREKQRFIAKKTVKLDNPSLLEDLRFVDRLTVYCFEESSISESQLREIARSDPWRLFWTTSRDTGTSLFPHSAVEMTELQQSLVSWTKIYDFAFESMNRPTKDVIEDDDKFDAWLESESKRIERETFERSISAGTGQAGVGATDVFLVADKEGAKEIYAMNDPVARGRINKRQKIIQEKGQVKEQNLPDIGLAVQMEFNKMKAGGK